MKQFLQRFVLAVMVANPVLAFATPINPIDEAVRFASLPDAGFASAMGGDGIVAHSVNLSDYNSATGVVEFGAGSSVTFRDGNGNVPVVRDGNLFSWYASPDSFVSTGTSLITAAFDGLNVVGISFEMDTIWNSARGWLAADYEGDYIQSSNFTIGSGLSSYGIFLASPGDSCSGISKAYVDPPVASESAKWGISNIQVHTGPSCASVPEPGTLPLMLGALALMGLIWRRKAAVGVA